jgi:hypothetical protein
VTRYLESPTDAAAEGRKLRQHKKKKKVNLFSWEGLKIRLRKAHHQKTPLEVGDSP